ncbi:MAG TPA: CPBP family intramembrane glutamic endopeptidase [Steroidobacteraceae bacterium]|jgi:membrane protease YdiL (CAAX protease family)|nr:CPBP family intramembrane glutamic endopeptidase [Steroidobacteraceae bacterium]
MPRLPRIDARAATLVGAYLVLWTAATLYLAFKGADWTLPAISLAVFGAALPLLGIVLTRKAVPPVIAVRRPTLELCALLGFLVLYAVGFLGWGMSATRSAVPPGREQELLVLAVKLLVHVGAPALLLAALGAKIAPLFNSGVAKPGFWLPLLLLGAIILALMCVVSPALNEIRALHVSTTTLVWAAPAAFAWMAVEAGLCEEFLFRAVLQTRLAAVLKTQAGAVVTGALLFALAHVPGLYLRGEPGVDGYSTDPVQVMAFTVAALSPVAVLFGTLWARTRSLLLIVLLHAAVDVLPNLHDFVRTWTV